MSSLPEDLSPTGQVQTQIEGPLRSTWTGPVTIPVDFKQEVAIAFAPYCDIANCLRHETEKVDEDLLYLTMLTPRQRLTSRRLNDCIVEGNQLYKSKEHITRTAALETSTDEKFRQLLKYGPWLILGVRDHFTHSMARQMRPFGVVTTDLMEYARTEPPQGLSDSGQKGRTFAMMMGLFAEALDEFRIKTEIMLANGETLGDDKIKLDPAITEWAEKFAEEQDCGTDSTEHEP